MRLPLKLLGILGALLILGNAAPVQEEVSNDLKLEKFEFEHPTILPVEQDDFRKDRVKAKARASSLYASSTRLPHNFETLSYDLSFKPYFPSPGVTYPAEKNFTFDGSADILVEALVDSDRIIINAYKLNIQSYKVIDIYKNEVPINSISQDDSNQQLSLITNAAGIKSGGIYHIIISYTGTINSYLDGGIYYTSYNDPQGAKHYMIATHMEPFLARQVFPCFDEPSYKARFTITLQYPSSQVALSNMMEPTPSILEDGWSQMKFTETLEMSTYLVAFAVGPYVNASFVNKHNTLTRAWGWPGTEQYLQFAAENAGHCLYQLGEYTGIRFPLEKADQLGMPEFLAGAMENWGLIIYKYQYIAYNPTTMTTRDMEAAAKVMCHELAHQWFGDLVTTAWWDDLFLNEGFADYFMTFIQKFVYPKQAAYMDTLQVLNELQVGLNADIRSDAHPLVHPDGPAFDDITYNKGASMLRMLSDVLGPNVFQQGIQAYLKDREYANAVDSDLMNMLTKVAATNNVLDWCGRPLNVTDFMQPYLHQTNFPLIRYNNNQITGGSSFTQEPFGSTDKLNASQWGYKWTVPLTTSSLRHVGAYRQWLPATPCFGEDIQEEPKKRAIQWELTSVTSATYGRIIYDDIGFDRILQSIQQNDVNDNLKLTLLADEYYYMNREKNANRPYSYDRFLSLAQVIFNTPSFINTPCYSVFAQAQVTLEEVSKNFRDTIDYEMLPRMYKKLFQSTYNQLIWNNTDLWNIDTFSEVFLPFAVRYDIGDVQIRTMNMFAAVKSACSDSLNGTAWCNPYPTNVRKAVYCGAAKYAPATSDFFFQMLHAYNKEVITNPYFYQEYMSLLEGMSCTQQSATLKTLIRLFTTSTLNPSTLFGFLKYNPVASDALYNYMNDYPSQVINSTKLDAFLDAMTYNWNTYTRNTQFAELMNSFELSSSQFQLFAKYQAKVESQMNFRKTYGIKISQWMYDNLVVIGRTPWQKSLKGDVNYPTYKVFITPYIPGSGKYEWYRNMTFSGSINIDFNVIVPTSVITINAHRLIFDPSDIGLLTNTPGGFGDYIDLDLKNMKKDYDRGVVTIPTLNNVVIYPNKYRLRVDYYGFIFPNPNEGPASNTYLGGLNGRKGWIFTTDFEGGPGARSLLPCWDEPSYKGQFLVSVSHSTDMIVLSNSLETGTTVMNNGWSTTTFGVTDQMSSYLLAICVGHFSNLAKVSKIGTLTRMWTWSGMEQYGEFALNVTVGTMEFMNDYFSYDYPLPKLDVMALPDYTQDAGAMENYGLIIGEYSLFMIDPDYATTKDIATAAEVSAHEVVHQWFGDTVTLDWWNDIFLNEGFAQYWFANGINNTFPEQQAYAIDYNRFHVNQVALDNDCTLGVSKPVISDTPPVFGVEPYYKGAALLNLLNNALTPPVFQQGLSAYLRQYGFENAGPQDLWASLTEAARENNILDWNGQTLHVEDFMNQYTLQTSYPLITLTLRGTSTVQAFQHSCLGDESVWNIPLFTQTPEGTNFNWYVNTTGGNDATWLRPLPSPWRLDNAGSTSFARINYDDKSWYSIQAALLNNYNSMSSTSRAMLLNDARFFFESGRWSIEKFLDLTLYLVNEDSLAPWEQAIRFFTDLLNRFQYQDTLNIIQNYVIQTTTKAHNNLQFNINGIWTHDRMVQELVDVNDLAGNRQTRLVSMNIFNDFLQRCQYSQSGTGKCSGIHPNLRASSYCYGLLQSTQDSDFVTVQNLYDWFVKNGGYLQTDGANLLNALGCSKNKELLKLLLDDILLGEYPASLLKSIALHDNTASILFDYLNDNTERILLAPFDFSTYIDALFTNWSTDVLYNKGSNFEFTTNWDLLTFSQQVIYRNGLSQVQNNINWMNTYQVRITTWIQKNFGTVNV